MRFLSCLFFEKTAITIAFPMIIANDSTIRTTENAIPSERVGGRRWHDHVPLFAVVEFTVELFISMICVESVTGEITDVVKY